MKYFVGLDLSLTGSGLSILDEKGKIVKTELIKSKKTGEKPVDELLRIMEIRNNIFNAITSTKKIKTDDGDALYYAIEGMAFLAKGTSLVQLAALNYFIREWIMYDEHKFVIIAPTSLKRFATGKGNSEKDHMILEAYKKFGIDNIDNNIADSLFLASAASMFFGDIKTQNNFQKETIDLLKKQL